MTMRAHRFLSLGLLTLVLFLASCATTVPVKVLRPAELDLQGAKSLSILPLGLSVEDNSRGLSLGEVLLLRLMGMLEVPSPEEQDIAQYIERSVSREIQREGFLEVVPSNFVTGYLQNPTGKPPVDVYLTGRITRFNIEITEELVEKKVDGANKLVMEYTKRVDMRLDYDVVDARSNRIIDSKFRNFDTTVIRDNIEHRNQLPEALEMFEYSLNAFVGDLLKELQPYEVTRYLRLEKDESKNPDFAEADKMVKAGLVEDAYMLFTQIYRQTANFAAGYNAALLVQAFGSLEDARAEMDALNRATADPRATRALAELDREIAASKRLQQQLDSRH